MSASPPPMEVTTQHCGHCGGAATQLCAGCRNIKYCDKQCQKQDWPLHKHLCKTFADFATAPGPNLRRIIILPNNAPEPYFPWMDTRNMDDDDEEGLFEEMYDFDNELNVPISDREDGGELFIPSSAFGGDCSVDIAFNVVLGKRCWGELLDHSLNFLCRCKDIRIVNQCLDNLMHGHAAKMDFLGCGDKAIFAMSKVRSSVHTRDVDCSDLTLAINGWVEWKRRNVEAGDELGWMASDPFSAPEPKAKAAGSVQDDSSGDELSDRYSEGYAESVRDLAGSRPVSPARSAGSAGSERMSGDIKKDVVDAFLARFEEEESDSSGEGEEEETANGRVEGDQ